MSKAMAKNFVRENVPLSRFGVLVAQLESIVASAAHKPPDPLLCFDLLSDLISAIEEEPKESILLWQRKCEDTLYTLLVLGARRPVRHLASVAMAKIISKGDGISIYSRASSLQGFLSDGKKSEAQKVSGAAQCLGELYRCFGRRIVSGFLETTNIVVKLLKFSEDFVRQEALHMLRNALEGSGGSANSAAYTEAFRAITRIGVVDKCFSVRIAAAKCLKSFANIGGPGIGLGELENCLSLCVKALEDPVKSVRDAFAEALGALLALGMNPDAQVQPRGKSHVAPKKLEGGLQKHLCIPFIKVSGPRSKDIRVGLSLSWVCLLQVICLKYFHPDSELQDYALQVMDMLHSDTSTDAQALACVLYVLRIGVTDQMTEPTQRGFLVFLGKQLQSPDFTPSMRVATLRTLSYVLKTLGEVPLEFKEVLDDTVVAALSHYSPLVRVEAALTLRALAEVDPSCVGGLISYAMTMLCAARENVSFEKASNFKEELESLHGQAAVLASLVSISRKLHLGYPARLPSSVLDVCKKLLMESGRNPAAAAVEKEAGWTILSSLLSSMSMEELQDQVFDILSLWAPTFSRNPRQHINQSQDLASEICMWSAAMDALTSFIKCFLASDAINRRILLQPVLLYLNRALSYISQVVDNERPGTKPLMSLFIVRVLLTYQALSDPSLYKSDHGHIIQICTTPFREASKCEESSCLMMLLDKRDAWLGPWTPGRDWFEDELRSFLGGKDGVLTCVWENELPSFPQPETISKMLVNQMLLCFGTMFAFQDSNGMLKFIGMMDQCLKAGKKQIWHTASITNICVGLLAGLKTLLALRPEPLGMEILSAAQAIFQSILAEGDICASQRRASAEGLGLLARLGNDIFTARLTKLLLGDVTSVEDSNYTGSISLALGCIHRSAGGMALSSLVPTTVNVVSSLAKSPISSLQIWSLHALILTIEAAGLSYVTHVQTTLGLAMEILLSEESGLVDLQQAVGSLINAIVAVIGPELSPDSIFFSRCKSAIAEISSCQETATLLESVRFTQQLVLFAPQAVSVHCHVQTLLPTLISRQPTLRHLALSTLRHLIEKDPISIIDEQIEETLFHMLDEETNTEIGQLARTTIMRLLYASCPSRSSQWLSICRNMILSTSSRRNATSTSNNLVNSSIVLDGEKSLNFGEDDENMVSTSKNSPIPSYVVEYTGLNFNRDKHLRYRTRVFAAECLNHLPHAVGENPAHFDLLLARQQTAKGPLSRDWLVLQLQELISLAYQISTIQFEKMQPIGVSLLCTVMDKFAASLDPDLPDHVLLEQYQAQLVSAVRSALDSLSGPILLEAGLQLATKMLTSGIISRDQVAVKRIFSLIARPLDDFNGLYYPSYAEWVSCKIKIRLLTVHASLKCYMFAFLRKQGDEIPDEYLALLPLFSKSSSILGTYWLSLLNDYCFVRFHLHLESWKPFLDGIQTPVVLNELQPCLEEAWPVILQALVLDAVPVNSNVNRSAASEKSKDIPISRYSMVELRKDEFDFLWGFLLMILFQEQDVTLNNYIIPVYCVTSFKNDIPLDGSNSQRSKLYDIFFPVFQFMITERFFTAGFLTMDACKELLEVFLYLIFREDAWDSLGFSIFLQVIQKCPKDFLEEENFAYLTSELCLTSLFKILLSNDTNSCYSSSWETIISVPLITASTLLERAEPQMRLKLLLPFLLIGFKCIGEASNELYLARIFDFVKFIISLPKGHEKSELVADGITHLASIIRACLCATAKFTNDCIDAIHQLQNKSFHLRKILYLKLAFSVEQVFSLASLAFVFEGSGDSLESNPVLFRMLHHSIQCIQAMLGDSDIQIQAVGLQVVKVILQKGIGAASNTFLIFFVGELVGDLLIIIQNVLEKHVEREAVAIAGECLKILTLLHTLSKGCDHQKGVINLLLEAILTIFSISDGSLSQQVHDLQSVSIKIVSQLAQIPSSAVSVKEILLAMPTTQRQQLQDIIRASVTQYQIPKPAESSGAPLVIKLPSQTEQNETNSSLQLAPPKDSTEESDSNSTVEEDDDWDTFQSFPASRNGTAPAEERGTSCSDNSIGDSTPPSCGNKENLIAEDQDLDEGADKSNQMVEHHVTEEGSSGDNESFNFYQLSDNIEPSNSDSPELCNIMSDQVQDEFETTVTSPSNENNQLLSDAIDTEIKEIRRDPSDRHSTGSSHRNKQGLSEPQSTEIAFGHDELSREDVHEDGMDINGRDNSIDCGQERLSLSKNYSLVVSTIEHASQSKPDPLP
ncbi:protein SWEETIE isoform X1 [Primulina eburnea]|uniref:protein SWEETIE isoform X1 n=1 Tax=Primulina eburnea TaxID=1245227 RepID=UPI003C6BF841